MVWIDIACYSDVSPIETPTVPLFGTPTTMPEPGEPWHWASDAQEKTPYGAVGNEGREMKPGTMGRGRIDDDTRGRG